MRLKVSSLAKCLVQLRGGVFYVHFVGSASPLSDAAPPRHYKSQRSRENDVMSIVRKERKSKQKRTGERNDEVDVLEITGGEERMLCVVHQSLHRYRTQKGGASSG